MQKGFVVVLCFCVLLLFVGCQNTQSRATEGAVIGGLLGATAGGIIGHQSGHGGEGAGIGIAAGVLTGALVGAQIKKTDQSALGTTAGGAQGTNANQMAIQQIVDLSKQGVNEDVIVDRIRLSNSRYSLTVADIDYLKQQGVTQKVINAMQGM